MTGRCRCARTRTPGCRPAPARPSPPAAAPAPPAPAATAARTPRNLAYLQPSRYAHRGWRGTPRAARDTSRGLPEARAWKGLGTASVPAPSRDDPLMSMAGDLRDPRILIVVVQDHRRMGAGDRSQHQI